MAGVVRSLEGFLGLQEEELLRLRALDPRVAEILRSEAPPPQALLSFWQGEAKERTLGYEEGFVSPRDLSEAYLNLSVLLLAQAKAALAGGKEEEARRLAFLHSLYWGASWGLRQKEPSPSL